MPGCCKIRGWSREFRHLRFDPTGSADRRHWRNDLRLIPGSESDPNSKPAISTAGSLLVARAFCQPHSPLKVAAVAVGLSAQRIYQDLVCEHGFTGSYQAVKRFVGHLRETQPKAGTILDRFPHHTKTIRLLHETNQGREPH
ncbi:MAG TPA: hypothetical protein VNX46_02615 [Candidatus Acidoferrum sp.]|jgi:hypothetical protein|nr:hypothetical protein [Candidatus Acidoferrum sp.]